MVILPKKVLPPHPRDYKEYFLLNDSWEYFLTDRSFND